MQAGPSSFSAFRNKLTIHERVESRVLVEFLKFFAVVSHWVALRQFSAFVKFPVLIQGLG